MAATTVRDRSMPAIPEPVLDFAQLWPTEQKTLIERAARVPNKGVVVEIGTAQGGSASLFHSTAGRRGVAIYSFDMAPSTEAYERLQQTGVTIIAKPSVEGAREWDRIVGRPVDLLFVDGGHALVHVLEDFNAWVPLLRPGGEVIFHDYDSVERGGLVHLGSYVVLRTILGRALLQNPVHTDRLLFGSVGNPGLARVTAAECYLTLTGLAREIVRGRDADYAGWTLVGEAPLARLLSCCLRLSGAGAVRPPERAPTPGRFLVFSRPLAPALEALAQRSIASRDVLAVDNLNLCYFVARALANCRDALLRLAASRSEFFRWEEVLYMFEHAFGPSSFPDEVDAGAESDVAQLSALVAREQVRLTVLARLLEGLTGEKP